MIIFGSRSYLYQLAILTLVCGRCGNPAAHTLKKRVTKFTLFFVPLFPISAKHSTQCTFCGTSQRITKEQAQQLLAQVAPAADAGAAPVTPGAGQQGVGGQPQQNQQNPYKS